MQKKLTDMYNEKEHTPELLAGFVSDSLRKSVGIYLSEIGKCKESFSEVATHDARVSIRRFISLLELCAVVSGNPVITEIRGKLKKQLKFLGPLRDTQVQILKVTELIKQFPELTSFYHELLKREHVYIKGMKSQLISLSTHDIENMTEILINDIIIEISDKSLTIRDIFAYVDDAYTDMTEKIKAARKDNLKSIHKVRLAFKKFRYMMEHLSSIIGLSKEKMAEFKAFQTIMGEIQDFVVFKKMFTGYLAGDDSIPSQIFSDFRKEFDSHGEKLINKFFDELKIIASFKDL